RRPGRGRALGVAVWLACTVVVVRAADDTTTDEGGQMRVDQGTSDPPDQPPPAGKNAPRLEALVVEARKPMSAASAEEIRAHDYDVRPHETMMQILNNLPGLVVAQHQGGSKAPQWFLRGFDADHGTDVAVSVDGLPINMVTHAHGQGYADPNFIIPEVIDRIDYYKGPYFVRLGDFDTAGAINFVSKDRFKENFALAEGGSFDSMRYVAGVSPSIGNVRTLLAAQAKFTNGPFINPENLWAYNGYAKLMLDPTPDSRLALSAA